MEANEAAEAAAQMAQLFHAVEPEHAAHWTKEFKRACYKSEDVLAAMSQLRSATNFFDPERFHAIHRRIRQEESDKSGQFRRSQEKLSERGVLDWWLAADTCVDAMSEEEFNALAQIALIEVPENIRARFASRNLREIKSIRGRVFELFQTEQPV